MSISAAVVGDCARGRRVAKVRDVARWLLPSAGAVAAVLLSAGAAHASADQPVYGGPASPTTGDTLSWTVSGTPGDPLDCTLLRDGTPIDAVTGCDAAGAYSWPTTTAGTYVLEVTDTTDGSPAADSAPVTVVDPSPPPTLPAPDQPAPSAPPSPDSNTSPTWTLGLPTGSADGTCTVRNAAQTVVAGPATCSGTTWTSDLGASAPNGKYTLSVVVSGDGISTSGQSTPGTATYSLLRPGAVTVTAPGSTGHDTTPHFTIAEAAPAAASFTCTLTLPDASTTAITTGCGVGTLTPTLAGGDGLYTLTVLADDGQGNTTSSSADYTLDTAVPSTPTVSRSSATGSTTTPTFTVADIDPGTTVSCHVSAGASVTACSPSAVSISITGGEGGYVVSVTETDAAGNSATGTFTYTLDITAPKQPTVSRTPALDKTRSPSFTVGTVDAGTTVTCDVSAGATVTGCSATGVSISITGNDGDYVVSVTSMDAAGNSSTGTFTYTLDTAAPTQPTVSRTPARDKTRTPSFGISGVDAGTTVTCDVSAGATVTGCSATGVSISITGNDVDYVVSVTSTDAAGNSSTGTFTYTLDTTPPTTPVLTRTKPVDHTTTPSFGVSEPDADATVTCSVSAGATITACSATGVAISITGGEGGYVVSVKATDAAGNSSTGTFTYTLDTTPPTRPAVSRTPALDKTRTPSFGVGSIDADATVTCSVSGAATVTACSSTAVTITIAGADGDYAVSVTATDPAGNTATGTFTYTLDTTAPTAPVITRSKSVDHDTTPSFTVTEPDSDATVTCGVSAGATVTACSANGVTISITGGDGDYVVSVTASDPLGNAITTTYTYTLDTTPPTTPTVTRTRATDKTRAPSFAVSTVDADATVTCSVSAGATVTSCSRTGATINITGSDGDYVVSVTATDPAGNTSTGTFTYTLDTTPPPVPAVSAPPALTNSTSVSLTISDTEADTTLTCVLTAPGGATILSGACPGTFNTSGHGDGTYTLVVTATDPSGNSSSTTVTWVRDTTPPPAPTVSTLPALTNSTSVTLAISDGEASATLTCVLTGPDGGVLASGACPAGGTFDTSGHADGVYTLKVTATDAAGNTSSTTVSWTRDTVPPARPTVTGPTSPNRGRTPSFTVTDTDIVATWQCTVTGPTNVAITTCGPTTTLDLTSAADGTYTVSVVAVDAAGNASAAASMTYTLDTTPPPPPSVSAPPALTKQMSIGLSISDSETGAVLTCALQAPGGATVLSGSCPGTFDTTGLGDGTYTLVVTATDAAGNSSTTTVSWVRDTTPPPVPSVIAPRSPSKVTRPVFVVSDSEVGVTFTCTVTGPSTVTANCGATTTVNLAGAADGTYTLSVTATDAAGNVSAAGSATYLLDTTPPTAPVVTVNNSPSQGRHPSYSISGIEAGGVLTCTLSGPPGSTIGIPQACSSSVSLDLTGQPDGTYALQVTVTDAAGNISASGGISYVLDTTPPAAPLIAPPASPGNDRTPTLTVSAEDGATLSCTIDRYFQQVWSGKCAPDGTLDLTPYADGEFEITITATDAAGNVSAETTVTYVLDTVAPAAPVLTEPASPSPIVKPVWLFTAEDGTIATCTITGPTGEIVQGPQQCTSPFVGMLKGLPDGTYTLTVVVTDAAGNASVPARSVFVLDRQAPVPPTVTPPRSPDSSRTPVWHISAPKGATLTCTLLRGSTVIDTAGSCPAGGAYSLDGLPDGTYTLRVTATDSAGNVSATSVTTYVLDTVRPAEPRLDYSAPSPSLSVKPYWGFTLPTGTTGTCELLHNGDLLASRTDCKGAVSFDLTGRPAGTYTVRIVAVDGAGNVSRALTASYVLGVTSPIEPPPSTGGTGGVGTGAGPVSTPPQQHGTSHHGGSVPGFVQQVLVPAAALPADLGEAGKKVITAAKHVASAILPDLHDKVAEHVSKAVQGVVNAVTHAGGGTGFPLLLLVVVFGFLVVQNRIDRRDPKLALASVAADDTIEFRPPPSRGSR